MDSDDPDRLVVSSSSADCYHKPVDPEASKPKPVCRQDSHPQKDNWVWRDKETAYAWKRPCSYCYNNVKEQDHSDVWPAESE